MAGSSSSNSPRTPREANNAKRSRKGCWYVHFELLIAGRVEYDLIDQTDIGA
jgi:hypothetical protein